MRTSLAPVHPGEILAEEFMSPLGISQYRLAKETHVPARRINEIVQGQRAITADTALRLAKFFGTSEMFWLNLQARFDLDVQKAKLGSQLVSISSLMELQRAAPRRPRSTRSSETASGPTRATAERRRSK